jgi:hypothetical protein
MRITNSAISALILLSVAVSAGHTKSLRDAGDPAESPPAGYSGAQFVDSQGCVYVRAGYDGNVTWVPRVSRDRVQMCGLAPTFGTQPATVAVQNARSILVAAQSMETPGKSMSPAPVVVRRTIPVVPAGFRPAWSDGRLNPNRGVGTVAGNAQMARLWTQTVPQRLISDSAAKRVTVATDTVAKTVLKSPLGAGIAIISTKSVSSVAYGPTFVQVAMFGVSANAAATSANLRNLGIPVNASEFRRSGKTLISIMAGPFANPAQAATAMATIRRAGFLDAYIRK